MKTINSKNSVKFSFFTDPTTDKYIGFAGPIKVYSTEIFVDTRSGKGYDKVIKNLEPMIYNFAAKYHFNGNTFDDNRHDVIVHILEGIPKYDPRREMKLSSFIQMRVARRLINELRDKSRNYRNATFLNISTYSVSCPCGHGFVETVSTNEDFCCPECNKTVDSGSKTPINIQEVNESTLGCVDDDPDLHAYFNVDESIYHSKSNRPDEITMNKSDMSKWLGQEDPRVARIVELIYFNDYSITAAAKEVGLTGAGANIKLKNLRNNKVVKELFNR